MAPDRRFGAIANLSSAGAQFRMSRITPQFDARDSLFSIAGCQ
jgi:hypothetical protein